MGERIRLGVDLDPGLLLTHGGPHMPASSAFLLHLALSALAFPPAEEATVDGKWENPVRKLLAAGQPVMSATLTVASVEIAAQVANMGFDFLWVEMEHSPIDLETLREMV